MSRFRKLSHTLWHCQYHIIWTPKYRFRILVGAIKEVIHGGIQAICGFAGCEVVELNVQKDHVHLVVMVPPKLAISDLMGRVKGQTAMKVFNPSVATGLCADRSGSCGRTSFPPALSASTQETKKPEALFCKAATGFIELGRLAS